MTNEAAERLRERMTRSGLMAADDDVDAALAEERRHVIEQIDAVLDGAKAQAAMEHSEVSTAISEFIDGFRVILDDLSTPEQDR